MNSTEGVVEPPNDIPQQSNTTSPGPTTEPMDTQTSQPSPPSQPPSAEPPADAPMSKNALKRLRKRQEWEDGRADRIKRRKEKRSERRDRVRTERAAEREALVAQGLNPAEMHRQRQAERQASSLAPIGIIVDCDFDQYMLDKERISLGSQITRSYSDNRQARYRSHLWIAGWKDGIQRRFREVLQDQQKGWKGIGFCEGDFIATVAKARLKMEKTPGDVTESLQKSLDEKPAWTRDEADPFPLPDPEPPLDENNRDVVYLSSDSPYTLERLEPNTYYVVGGLVDKNREKGLCYRRARERGIRTARLPIGQYMLMQSRQVLATNHVVEIMLKWLEFGDWGQAFLSVIPKRKGGRLIGDAAEDAGESAEDGDAGGDAAEHDETEAVESGNADLEKDEDKDEDDDDNGVHSKVADMECEAPTTGED